MGGMQGPARIGAALVVVFAGASQPASTQQAQERPVFRTGTNLVIIDAVVVDGDGRHVRDLTADEFEVVQEGRTQPVRQALYVAAGLPAGAPDSTEEPGGKPPAPAAAAPPAPRGVRSRDAAPAPDARVIAIVVDDLGLSFESTAAVRTALAKFVDTEVAAGDLVAILRTSAGVGTLQQFTTDTRLLHAAIDRLNWTILSRAGVTSFAPIAPDDALGYSGYGGSGTAETDDENSLEGLRTSISATGSLGALDYIIRGVESLPGRKSVVFVSEGMRLFTKPEGFSTRGADRVRNAFTRVMDRANRAGVVVYTMDPRGLATAGLTAEDNPQIRPSTPGMGGMASAAAFDEKIRKGLADRLSFLRDSQEALTYIAEQTGGFAILNTNDLSAGLRRVVDDLGGYYLLGFEGASAALRSWDPGRVTVRVKRPGLRVRSRKGLFGPADEGRERAAVEGDPLVMAALSPFGATSLDVRLTTLFGHDTREGSFVRSLFFIDPAGVSFTRRDDGRYVGQLTVLVLAVGDDGRMKTQWRRAIDLQLTQASYETAKKRGILYSASIPMKAPGAYQLRVAVRDERTNALGSASQFIEVPGVGKGRVAMSGIVLQGVDAAGVEVSGAAPAELEQSVLAEPAIRIFRQGSEAVYAYEVYDGAPGDKSPLLATTTLMRDGRVVHQAAPVPIASKGGSGPVRVIPTVGRLSLTNQVEPGFYTLRIAVTRMRSGRPVPQATQWASFEVRP
jgi:VWFA-related protein